MDLIPEGRYKARGRSWGFGKTSTGIEQMGIMFGFSDPDGAERTLTWYGFFNTEENGKRALKVMRICGWDENDADVLNPKGLDKNEVEIVVKHEEYNGETQARIAFVNAIGVALKPLPEDDKAKLANKIKGWMKPIGNGQRGSQRPQQRQTQAPKRSEGAFDPGPPDAAEDDIPF